MKWEAGQQALAAIARATDGRGERTALDALVRAHCGVADNKDLLGCANVVGLLSNCQPLIALYWLKEGAACCPQACFSSPLAWQVSLSMSPYQPIDHACSTRQCCLLQHGWAPTAVLITSDGRCQSGRCIGAPIRRQHAKASRVT